MGRNAIFLLIINFIIRVGCKKATSNNPESVAQVVVESLITGNYESLKKYATDDAYRMIDTSNAESMFHKAKVLHDMSVVNLYVTELSYDGTVKDVYLTMENETKKMNICVTLVDVNGKWLYNRIAYK